jgi:nucleoside-diphosphate-sugar epimerase
MHPTRDLVFVKDTVAGFAEIAKSDKTIGEEINIATQTEISIGDLAQKIIMRLNPDARILTEDQRLRPEKSEVERLLGSNQKILSLTNWKQKFIFESGLEQTIAWFKEGNNLSRYKSEIYNL